MNEAKAKRILRRMESKMTPSISGYSKLPPFDGEENEKLLAYYLKTRSTTAINALVLGHSRLVAMLVSGYLKKLGADQLQDIMQQELMIARRCIEKFDPKKRIELSSFISASVRKHMKSAVAEIQHPLLRRRNIVIAWWIKKRLGELAKKGIDENRAIKIVIGELKKSGTHISGKTIKALLEAVDATVMPDFIETDEGERREFLPSEGHTVDKLQDGIDSAKMRRFTAEIIQEMPLNCQAIILARLGRKLTPETRALFTAEFLKKYAAKPNGMQATLEEIGRGLKKPVVRERIRKIESESMGMLFSGIVARMGTKFSGQVKKPIKRIRGRSIYYR